MPTKLNNSLAVGTLTAISMMAGVARGDEGAGEFHATAANSARDGENNPRAPATCRAGNYAESSVKTD